MFFKTISLYYSLQEVYNVVSMTSCNYFPLPSPHTWPLCDSEKYPGSDQHSHSQVLKHAGIASLTLCHWATQIGKLPVHNQTAMKTFHTAGTIGQFVDFLNCIYLALHQWKLNQDYLAPIFHNVGVPAVLQYYTLPKHFQSDCVTHSLSGHSSAKSVNQVRPSTRKPLPWISHSHKWKCFSVLANLKKQNKAHIYPVLCSSERIFENFLCQCMEVYLHLLLGCT